LSTYTLKLAETWPSNFPIFGDATKKFKQLAEAMSNGRLKIRIDSKNKHKSALGIFDFVKSGQYDLGHSGSELACWDVGGFGANGCHDFACKSRDAHF
jgi:TRAP-type mannitol/chloroaromatic compound transport system substrate-binding protein